MVRTRRQAAIVFAVLVAVAWLLFVGARPIDALLLAMPLAWPSWWRSLPRARRRRLLCVEVPVLVVAALGGGVALAADAAHTLGASLPIGAGLGFGGYVLLWVVALRAVQATVDARILRLRRRRWLARTVAAVVTLLCGLPPLWVALQTHRIAVPQLPTAPTGRTVEFTTTDGVRLAATFVPAPVANELTPLVVVCHGLGANRAACFGYAELATANGCHALAFDFRAHGESGGAVATFGHDEVLDVAAAVGWARSQPELARAPLLLCGVSMGAASALQAAAGVGADGVFTESSFADLHTMVAAQARGLGPLAPWVADVVAVVATVTLGVDLAAVSPRERLALLPPELPVCLVHAGDDVVIPVEQGERLAAARPGTLLHRIEGAAHGACLAADPARVGQLFRDLLAAARAHHSTRNK